MRHYKKKKKCRRKYKKNPSEHHVPPTSSHKPTQFIMTVPQHVHDGYHFVFGNAESYEECCEILKKWWFREVLKCK